MVTLHDFSKFFFAILFLVGCSTNLNQTSHSPIDISRDERVWMEKFLKDFVLEQQTVYTVFGSKPLSGISICYAAKEEWSSGVSKMIQEYPDKEKQQIQAEMVKYISEYDLPKNWEKWIEWSSKHLDKSFLFSKRATYCQDIFSAFILNVQETAWILQKYYSLISEELDMEFDPLQVVLEFENTDSIFWEKVFNNHFVQGILHGYGERNSYFFSREMQLKEKNGYVLGTDPVFRASPSPKRENKGPPLPSFRSYYVDISQDPVYQQYQREKSHIRKVLKGKNTVDLILKRLGYEPNSQKGPLARALL
jgi:hypothetical protein